jgi:hypothetical protein
MLHVLDHPWYLVKSTFTAFAHRRCSLVGLPLKNLGLDVLLILALGAGCR